MSTDRIIEIGEAMANNDTYHGATYETVMLMIGEIKRLKKFETDFNGVMEELRGVEIYPHNLNRNDDNFGRPTCNEMDDSFRAVCSIRMRFPDNDKGGRR